MQFELTEALIDDILFSMEDQEGVFYLDTLDGVVIGGNDSPDFFSDEDDNAETGRLNDGRYIDLPEWDSASGFRLMERFVASFRNPLIREELSSALGHGKGVFRAFKDTLSRHPEAEKLWFSFKEKEMKREIIGWYNGLREEWGLEKIGMEPEETADLVLEDFRFRPFQKEDTSGAEELHRLCQEEYKRILAENGAKNSADAIMKESQVFHHSLSNLFDTMPVLPSAAALIAESGGGEFAGYISGIVKDSILYIQSLEVKPEYRGLGIGEALLVRCLDCFDRNELVQVFLDLPSWAEGFSRVLLRESFKPYTIRYRLNLQDREN